jgi:hypothetical protein
MELNNLIPVLHQCLNKDNEIRKEAESQIRIFANSDFGNTLILCSHILGDESQNIQIRQLCATLIKNLITIFPEHTDEWTSLSSDVKEIIKNNICGSLGSSFKQIRKASALCVAGILHLT